MRKLKLLKDWNGKEKGEIVEVENNVAHSMIDLKQATLNLKEIVDYPDKMMRPNNKIIKRKNAGNTRKPKTVSRYNKLR